MKALPPWNDAMSDGCSIPAALRSFFPSTPEVRACCVRHDERYYYGGSRADRLRADLAFGVALLDAGVSAETVEKMVAAVRAFGGPSGRRSYSWAFGGGVFEYSSSPARPS
jgi:hypothetical protein